MLKTLIQLLDENERFGVDDQTTLSSSDEEDNNMEIEPDPQKFKAKSSKFPQLQTCPVVWAFLKQNIKHVEGFSFPPCFMSNLSQGQQSALRNNTQNGQIIVKPADKGGNVVIMDRYHHVNMCDTILNNNEWYQQIPQDTLIDL